MPDVGKRRAPNCGHDIHRRMRRHGGAERRVIARQADKSRQGHDLDRGEHDFAKGEGSSATQVHQGKARKYGSKQQPGVRLRHPDAQDRRKQCHFRSHDEHERSKVRRAHHESRGWAQIAFGIGAKCSGRRMSTGQTAQAGHQRYRHHCGGQIRRHSSGSSRQQWESAPRDQSVADDGAEGDHRHLPSGQNRWQPGFSA
ncbi:hypothetical protein D3C71_1644400 [compost metagenome]